MNIDSIQVILMDMPPKVGGTCCHNEDDSYTIFLDARSSYEQQLESYWHEIAHIENRDIYSEEAADSIEARRHKKTT